MAASERMRPAIMMIKLFMLILVLYLNEHIDHSHSIALLYTHQLHIILFIIQIHFPNKRLYSW